MQSQRDGRMTNGDSTGAYGSDLHHDADGVRLRITIEKDASVDVKADSNDMTVLSPYTDNGVVKLRYLFSAQSLNSLEAYVFSFTEYLKGRTKTD